MCLIWFVMVKPWLRSNLHKKNDFSRSSGNICSPTLKPFLTAEDVSHCTWLLPLPCNKAVVTKVAQQVPLIS